MFLRLLDSAEGARRRLARVRGGHPFGEELVLEQPQMRLNLARELVFSAIGLKERQDPEQEPADGSHGGTQFSRRSLSTWGMQRAS